MGNKSNGESRPNIQSSIFPTEEGQIENFGQFKTVKMPCVTQKLLTTLSMNGRGTLSSMLRTAWGLVLRSYLGTSNVCFGTLSSADEYGGFLKDQTSSLSELHVCQLNLLADLALCDALEQAGSDQLRSLNDFTVPRQNDGSQFTATSIFNTCVLITLEGINPEEFTGQFDLSLHIAVSVESIEIFLFYKMDKFSHWQVTNIVHSFHEAIHGILRNESGTISEIQLYGSHDQGILDIWNTAPSEPITDCLHSAIARQASIQPHATAVCSWEIEWSYEVLEKLATRVASRLVKYGIRPEVLVPLYFEKSAWTIVAMLAVLKAGGAFVALDPRQPKSRIRAILAQLVSPVLVTSAYFAHQVAELGFDESTSVIVSEDSTRELELDDTNFKLITNHTSPAYVIFTSGSTGEPKGVVIEHQAIYTSCVAHAQALSILASSRVLQFASYGFDASIAEIFTTLTVGGCVCVPSDEERNNVVKVINSLRVNHMILTPTVLRLIRPADVPTMKTVVSVGEKMPTLIRDLWARRVELLNGYGPTECAVCSSAAHITVKTPPHNIGYPVGCRFWVVDSLDPTRLAPLGIIGELYVEGATLARGYIKDQEKTRAAFVHNLPWIPIDSSGKPKRVYKTGDFVQYNHDGSLNFIGRKDFQVKIHGQRIELGEIDHLLRATLPGYQFVTVELVRLASQSDTPVLVAFLSETSDETSISHKHDYDRLLLPMTHSLRSTLIIAHSDLLDSLPAHMVPSLFIPLHYMPLNISRKVDRKILRQIASSLSLEESFRFRLAMAPEESLTTHMEVSLQALWASVLHLSPDLIRPESNFFLLGGNSMSVIKLLAAARDRQINLPAADIFKNPTLRGLASRVSVSESLVVKTAIEKQEEIPKPFRKSLPEFLSFDIENVEDVSEVTDVQKIFLFFNHLQKASGFIRISFTFEGGVDADQLEAACRSAIFENQILRTVFVSNGDELLQVVLKNCPISFRRMSSEEWQHDTQANDYVASLDCFGAPLVHFVTIQSGSGSISLILQFSHAQYDAFSIPILIKSIHSLIEGNVCRPAPKFSRFVAATCVNQEKSEQYWRTILKDSELINLRTQSKAPYCFSQFRLKRQLIPFISMMEFGITTPSILKAAWSLTLAQLTGHEDTVFGEVVAGRNAPVEGIDELIGPCFNIIPIRIRSQPQTCLDLLLQIEEQHVSNMIHENLGILTIIDRCTTWPKWGRLGTAVNLRTSIDPTPTRLSFGEFTTKILETQKLSNFADIVLDTNLGNEGIYINLAYDNQVLSSPDAIKLLTYFCATVTFLVQSPNSSISSWQKLDPQVYILHTSDSDLRGPAISIKQLEKSDVVTSTYLVGKIWKRLRLPAAFRQVGSKHAFYEARNYFELALVLRDSYHRIGADLTLEEIMDHAVFDDHVSMVAERRKQ